MKHHLKHLAMCAPMILIGVILLVSGARLAALLPVVACVVMMGVMMAAMNRGER